MSILKSKKFWVSTIGAVAVALSHFAGIPEETTITVGSIIVAYVIGQGIADMGKEAEITSERLESRRKDGN